MNEDKSPDFSLPTFCVTVGFFVALWGAACLGEMVAAWLR